MGTIKVFWDSDDDDIDGISGAVYDEDGNFVTSLAPRNADIDAGANIGVGHRSIRLQPGSYTLKGWGTIGGRGRYGPSEKTITLP